VPPGTAPARDQIVCSNPFGVAAMVRSAGGEPRLLGIARDTRASLDAKIAEAADADILVTLGGASVGDHDLVGPALAACGMALDFWKIAMRPGKPMMFGRLGAQRVLGLPGNPVSSLITARLFLMPLIAALRGEAAASQAGQSAPLAVPLPANGPRAHYMRAVWTRGPDGAPAVQPLPNQDSSLLTPLAEATLLIVRPIAAPACSVGARVEILPLDF
jgi:molybdopterin molybdotransferase